MNTGIGDAANLAWKLGAVHHHRASAAILDTYEAERLPFARTLVRTTDRVFEQMVSTRPVARFLRIQVIPRLLGLATRFAAGRSAFFETVSQLRIHYRGSALSGGQAGRVRGGDRLPWLPTPDGSNFAPLRARDWQVHVYGEARPQLVERLAQLGFPLHRFAFTASARRVGFGRDAAYLVRPDGYVALALPSQDGDRLAGYASRWGLHVRAARSPGPSAAPAP
jgi:hypothetical protein